MAPRSLVRHAIIAAAAALGTVLLLLLLGAFTAEAAPQCRLSRAVTAGDLRSNDARGVLINVIGDWTNVPKQPTASTVKYISRNLTTTLVTGLRIAVEGAAIVNDTLGSVIAVTFKQLPTYWLPGINESVTMKFPPSLFFSGVPCPPLKFKVVPSAGVLLLTYLPAQITEIEINEGSVTFDIIVQYDKFLNTNCWYVNQPNFTITATLPGGAPNSVIRFTIGRNDTYNTAVGHVDKIVFIFNKYMMQSGVAPRIGDGISVLEVAVPVKGVDPVITVTYPGGAAAMASEDLWDGTAWAVMVMKGDKFDPNRTLWDAPATMPVYSPAVPKTPYGFDYFIQRGMRPAFNISERSVNLSFPALEGFTIAPVVDQVRVLNLGPLTLERRALVPVPLRVLRVRDVSPVINFTGKAFTGAGIDEIDIRRSGFNMTFVLKYNVWVDPPSPTSVQALFRSVTFPGSSQLSTVELVASVRNLTRLDLYLPPATSYDINSNEVMNVTVGAIMFETRRPMLNNSRLFNISRFGAAATCDLVSTFFVRESDIRNASGPAIPITISIIRGADQFCFNGIADAELRQSVQVTTGSGNPAQPLLLDYIGNTSTNISMLIRKDPSYEISAPVFLAITLPARIMCSLELCISNKAGGVATSTMQMAIGATAGELVGTMPLVSEAQMRTQVLVAVVTFVGDAFNVGAAGITRGDIPLLATIVPTDPYGRGFGASWPKSAVKLFVDGNLSRGVFTLQPNASFDIVDDETIYFTVVATRASSGLSPISSIVPLRIYPLPAFITILYPNMTVPVTAPPTTTTAANMTTTTTTVPATTTTPMPTNASGNVSVVNATPTVALWVINVSESEILSGNITINMTLTNDRFDVGNLAAAVRASLILHTALQPSGIVPNKAVALADNAFYVDRNEFFMSLRMKPTPAYDITVPESFTLVFNSTALVSRRNPAQYTIRINVRPDPGVLTMTGPATLISSFDVVNGFQSYYISIEGDKFVAPTPAFQRSELCIVTKGECEVQLDKSRRNITVTYDPAPDFFLPRNLTQTIQLRGEYFDSGVVPRGNTNVTVYLSGGRLEWFMTLTRVSEDSVRSGSYPGLAADKPIATAALSGDLFASKEEVRRTLAESVECQSADTSLVGQDPYGFCARAKDLMGSVFFNVLEERRVNVVLQPDDDFDIYAEETVTFNIGGGATQSRLAPKVAGRPGVITIYPTRGKFFISTSFVYLTEQDINSAALVSKVKLSVSLFGERWRSNVTRVVELVVQNMISDALTREINGWNRYRAQILPATTAGTTDARSRLLELQFVASARYDIFLPETVAVGVPAGAVMSVFAPQLTSVQSGFTIDTVGGLLSGTPLEVTADMMRRLPKGPAEQGGFNITLVLRKDFWNNLELLNTARIVAAFSSDRTPQEEPNGFTVNKASFLAFIAADGPKDMNATHVILPFGAAASYDLVNPERIRIDIPTIWTQLGAQGKSTTPSYFEFRVMPEFPLVNAVVYSRSDLTSNASAALVAAWQRAVAEKLAVIAPRIEIVSIRKEWMVPAAAPYYRFQFRVLNNADPTVPYDNALTRLFVSMDRRFLEGNFNTSFAFFNATPPMTGLWNTLEGAAAAAVVVEATGLALGFIFYFILGICVAIVIILAVRRYNQGKHKNGLNWGESEGRVKADARFTDSHEMDEQNFDKAAELLFAAQREMLPYLADDAAAASARTEAERARVAAQHGVVRESGIVQQGVASERGYRLKAMRPTADGRDQLAFFDVPVSLYAGQRNVTKRATDVDVGMPLIDRMDAVGTDHSSRISRAGNTRVTHLTDLLSPAEANRGRRPAEFVPAAEQRARDPALFGSEKRINELLERVAPGGESGYMTDLRARLMETGTLPLRAAGAEAGPKLWSDDKAGEIILPPHLVGKVSRFRPPSERK